MGYKCILLDDDPMDRTMLTAIVKKYPALDIVGVYSSAEELLEKANLKEIDVLFLDIDLPKLNGLQLREKLNDIPVCVFISSHPEFAVDTFTLDTLDFITKPLKTDRFQLCHDRIIDYLELKQKAQLYESSIGGDILIIKEGHKQTKVKLHEILYLEGLKDYTKIITETSKHIVLASIGNLLKEVHFSNFIRIQKSFAVQKDRIQKWDANQIYLTNGFCLPLSKNYRDNLKAIL
jgi:DNA-binding LytR/AlgR family response regulator